MSLLPDAFCWTRFGTEAGQSADSIFVRKEQERLANSGVFLWGIGNAIAPSMRRLLECVDRPLALFSPIHSRPRTYDVQPPSVVTWTKAECLDGKPYPLPRVSLVTSAWNPTSGRAAHYALVCRSEAPLPTRPFAGTTLNFDALRNLVTGNPVASSQTTAVVRRDKVEVAGGRKYEIAMLADLVWPYFLRLTGPVPIASPSAHDWQASVAATWEQKRPLLASTSTVT